MQDLEENNKSDFVIEKIKERPINKKKLLRRTLITASMAVMFGLIACFTFLIIEPIISNWLYPQEEPPKQEIFPEDEEEMKPEEMLVDNKDEEKATQGLSSTAIDKKKRQEVFAAMEYYQWDVDDYAKMYETLGEFARDLQEYLVTVTAQEKNQDWLDSTNSKKTRISGVVVGNNGRDLLILTSYNSIKAADALTVTFADGYMQEAYIMQKHTSSDIAIVAVSISAMGKRINQVRIAPLGYGKPEGYLTTPIIALGKTMEEIDVIQYGTIISHNNEASLVDANFELLMTDIYGTTGGTGFLFNLKGQIIGMVPGKKPSTEIRNMVMAYEISDIKRLISRLSNGYEIPYAGITGTMVSEEAHQEENVPKGIYVKNVALNSPAMKAGIQPGDVVVSINDKEIVDFKDYFNTLAAQESGSSITLKIKRLVVNDFKELNFNIVLSQAK
ncbi:MAG: serine protease [Lachnospiraceae bacterium]|nr:serine protease [Lachnospiraceae bacterium]